MTKFLALICVLFAVTASAADSLSCLSTALLKGAYGFSEASITMTSPKAYSDLKYCKSLASGACCTDTDINNIQALSDAYTKNLTALVSTRDTYITTVKSTVLPTLTTNIQNFNSVASKFITVFQQQMTSALSGFDLSDMDLSGDFDMSDDLDDSDFDDSDMGIDESDIDIDDSDLESGLGSVFIIGTIVDSFSAMTNMTTQFLANVDSIKNNYINYQNARYTCVQDIVDLQNSAMCLACDPNADTKGFTAFSMALADLSDLDMSDFDDSDFDGSDFDFDSDLEDESEDEEFSLGFGIAMSTATCTRIQNSCKPYISYAVGQNQLVEVTAVSAQFNSLTTAMQSFINGNYDDAMTQIATSMTADDTTTDVPALIGGGLPEDCNVNGNCEWICDGLFMDGMVNPMALLVGGEVSDGEDDDEEADEGLERRRLLAAKRNLDDGTWAPTKGDSGATVTFVADPANTDNSGKKFGSLNLGNVFVGMMVVISSILLF